MPLSFAQHRLWFLHQFETGEAQYVLPLGAAARPASTSRPSPGADRVVARHESLRTPFWQVDGVAAAVWRRRPTVTLPLLDRHRGSASCRSCSADEACRPFDLRRGPLCAPVVRAGRRRPRPALTMHHIVADGWSLGVLSRELAALLRGSGRPRVAAARLPIQYADYAAWQRELADGRGAGRRSSRTGARSWPARRRAGAADRPAAPAVQTFAGRVRRGCRPRRRAGEALRGSAARTARRCS